MIEAATRQLRHLLAPFEPWRGDPEVDEFCVNMPNEVFVRKRGRFERHAIDLDYDTCYDIAVLAGAIDQQQNVSDANPLIGADLPSGERLQAVLPPCVPAGTVSLTMRVPGSSVVPIEQATKRYRTDRWNQWSQRETAQKADHARILAAYDAGDIVAFFREVVAMKLGLILTGKTGAGKSSFLKTMMSVVADWERVITIENVLEVDIINQPNHVRLLYSHGSQGVAKVTQADLLQAYLRMRPDRGCVGELRDPDAAFTYVSECLTGHPGSPSTIHGRDAKQAAARLFNLFKASDEGSSFDKEMIKAQIGMAVDVIVPFNEEHGEFSINEVWLAADAARRGKDINELFEG